MTNVRPFLSCLPPVLLLVITGVASGQTATGIQIKIDPQDALVRPFEHATLRVLVSGYLEDKSGNKREGYVALSGAEVRVLDADRGGWVSKPFRCEHARPEEYVRPEGTLYTILGMADDFTVKDCYLYTAPATLGRYKLEATLKGFKSEIEIRVEKDALARVKPERVNFPAASRSTDPYREIAEHYAPVLAQETWFTPKADYLTRFDFDGDWHGDNNWGNLEAGTSQAYLYYTAMETATHWFLIYNAFHPRDYSDNCVAGTCHENDNEGVILTIRKDGTPRGRLELVETLAHNNVYSYRAYGRLRDGVHDIDGEVVLRDGSHPVVFVESGGHGIYSAGHVGHSRYDAPNDRFLEGTGVTYIYKGVAERPQHPAQRSVGYDLLPILEEWWSKASPQGGWSERTFDEPFEYQPFGDRPKTGYAQIPGAFLGRKEASNKARPFWGWFDNRTRKAKVLNTGQWGLDPAYAASRNVRFPGSEPFSLVYIYNPYLGITGGRDVVQAPSPGVTPEIRPEPGPPAPASPTPTASLGMGGKVSPSEEWDPGWSATPLPGSAPAADDQPPMPGLSLLPSRLKENPSGNTGEGQVDLRALVDGETEFYIRGQRIFYRVLSAGPPQDAGSEFLQALPTAPLQTFEFEQLDGREKVTGLEKPSAENNYTARIRVNDPRGGTDRYHIRMRWRR